MRLKKNKWVVPAKPDVLVQQRRDMSILGQQTKQVLELDLKKNEQKEEIEMNARGTQKKLNEEGFGSVHTSMQQPDATKLKSLIGMRIKYLSIIDMDKAGSETNVLWMGGTVERVSDGTWLMPGSRTKCYKEGEAAEVYQDAVSEANYPPGRTTEKSDQNFGTRIKWEPG